MDYITDSKLANLTTHLLFLHDLTKHGMLSFLFQLFTRNFGNTTNILETLGMSFITNF